MQYLILAFTRTVNKNVNSVSPQNALKAGDANAAAFQLFRTICYY